MEYLTKKEAKIKKQEFNEKVNNIKKESNYKFNLYLVGSSKRNLILVHKDKKFDMDYQLRINGQVNKSPKKIKEDFFKLFQQEFNSNEWDCDNSTSAITIKKTNKNGTVEFSYDIVICNLNNKTNKLNIIRRIKENEYSWEEFSEYSEHMKKVKLIIGEKWIKVREKYKEKKEHNLKLDENCKRKSFYIFVETVEETIK